MLEWGEEVFVRERTGGRGQGGVCVDGVWGCCFCKRYQTLNSFNFHLCVLFYNSFFGNFWGRGEEVDSENCLFLFLSRCRLVEIAKGRGEKMGVLNLHFYVSEF